MKEDDTKDFGDAHVAVISALGSTLCLLLLVVLGARYYKAAKRRSSEETLKVEKIASKEG